MITRKSNISVKDSVGQKNTVDIILGDKMEYPQVTMLDANATSELISKRAPDPEHVEEEITRLSNQITSVNERVTTLNQAFHNMLDADPSAAANAIDKFEEIVNFLDGIKTDDTAVGLFGLITTALSSKADRSDLNNYLSLSGGIMNGNITLNSYAMYWTPNNPIVTVAAGYMSFGNINNNTQLRSSGTLKHTTKTYSAIIWDQHNLPSPALTTDLSTVATSGSYNDLTDKPTNISSFTNDAGYLTREQLKLILPTLMDEIDSEHT